MVLSRDEKLARTLRDLREDLDHAIASSLYADSPSSPVIPIVPIASNLALEYFHDRESQEWRASNLDALLRLLPASPEEAARQAAALRGRRALALLERAGVDGLPDEGAREVVDRARRAIEALLPPLPEDAPQEGPLPPIPPALEEERGAEEQASDNGLFSSLLLSVREQVLRERFLAIPVRRVLLLGPDRREGLRLLSRLAHDSGLADPQGVNEGDWLLCGEEAGTLGTAFPFPWRSLPGDLGGLQILLAPASAFLGLGADAGIGINFGGLFELWTPALCLDLPRIDSALSDLARSPCCAALAAVPRWLLVSAQGGLFDRRLPDLALEVPRRARAFASSLGFVGRMDWFVCENYDPRYTDFIALGGQVRPYSSDEELAALAALWEDLGLDPTPPFTREALALALRTVRARLRSDAERLVNGAERSETGVTFDAFDE